MLASLCFPCKAWRWCQAAEGLPAPLYSSINQTKATAVFFAIIVIGAENFRMCKVLILVVNYLNKQWE